MMEVKPVAWNQQAQPAQLTAVEGKQQSDEDWKKGPTVQALVAERLQQLESECKADNNMEGKRKRSGRYNTTDSSASVPSRRWAVLVVPAKRHVTFDDLNETQFVMGFIKNVHARLSYETIHVT